MSRACLLLVVVLSHILVWCDCKQSVWWSSDTFSLAWQLWKHSIPTNTTTQVTDSIFQNYNPVYTSSGNKIGFVSERDGNLDLYTMPTSSSGVNKVRRITNAAPAADHHVSFSPTNDNHFAFVSSRDWSFRSAAGVYVKDDQGTHRLTPKYDTDISPVWSPDGQWIYAVRSEPEVGDGQNYLFMEMAWAYWHQTLVRMRPDGSDRETVLTEVGWPAFGSDPDIIYFHKYDAESGYWGVYSVNLTAPRWVQTRLSPPDVHALTPSVSKPRFGGLPMVAMAIYNPLIKGRQIAVVRGDGRGFEILTYKPDCPAADYNPAISPDGNTILFNRGSWPGSPKSLPPNVRKLASPTPDLDMYIINGYFPHFSPDGKQVAVSYQCNASPRFCDVYTMNTDGSNRKRIVKQPGGWMAAYSKDFRIAYATGNPFESAFLPSLQIATVTPNGTDKQYLTTFNETGASNGYAVYSPDFKTIVYRSGEGADVRMAGPKDAQVGNRSIWLMDADGSNRRQITKPVGNSADNLPEWSPDGKKITFSSNRGHPDRMSVWTMNRDGTDRKEIWYSEWGQTVHPAWSADGEWIAFSASTQGLMFDVMSFPFKFQSTHELFMIRPNATDMTRLTHDFITNTHPRFTLHDIPPPSTEGWTTQNGCQVPYPDPVVVFDPKKTKRAAKQGKKKPDLKASCPMFMHKLHKELFE